MGLRWTITGFCVAMLLAGCNSSGGGLANDIINDLTSGSEKDDGPPLGETITRARIEALGVAMIRTEGRFTPERDVLVALTARGDQILYVLRDERQLVLVGGLIQSTAGFGDNLAPIGTGRDDPVAYQRPLAQWPEGVTRIYDVADRGPGRAVAVTCTFEMGGVETLEIVENIYVVRAVEETCAGGDLAFTNRHLVEARTGFIWRSTQWTGPVQGPLTYDILDALEL